MRIGLIDLKDPRDIVIDKTIAGGMGTASRYGHGVFSQALTRLKSRMIRLLPYNIAYVSALLKSQGHTPFYSTHPILENLDCAVVFSAIPSREVDKNYVKTLGDAKIPSIVVGTIAGVDPEDYVGARLVIRGEAEAFFARPDWDDRLHSRDARGVTVLDAGQVQDLDALPFPDWSIFPSITSHYAIVSLSRSVLPVVTSRGCPFSCAYYCPYPLGEGKAMRFRSPESLVGELHHLRLNYGVRAFKFRDPIFTINRGRTLTVLEALRENCPDIIWGCETHLSRLDDELLEHMAAAGCRLIQTGIETTNPRAIQASKRKSAEVAHQERMLAACERLGIRTAIYLIFGLPEDTLDTMRASLDYACTLPATFVQITACTPYPGTRFFEDIRHAMRTNDWRELDQYTPVIQSDHFSAGDIIDLMSRGYRRFYVRPAWLRSVAKVELASAGRRLGKRLGLSKAAIATR